MKIGDLTTDRQSQAGTRRFRREEGLEDLRAHGRINPYAFVENSNNNRVGDDSATGAIRFYGDCAAFGHGLYSVL